MRCIDQMREQHCCKGVSRSLRPACMSQRIRKDPIPDHTCHANSLGIHQQIGGRQLQHKRDLRQYMLVPQNTGLILCHTFGRTDTRRRIDIRSVLSDKCCCIHRRCSDFHHHTVRRFQECCCRKLAAEEHISQMLCRKPGPPDNRHWIGSRLALSGKSCCIRHNYSGSRHRTVHRSQPCRCRRWAVQSYIRYCIRRRLWYFHHHIAHCLQEVHCHNTATKRICRHHSR